MPRAFYSEWSGGDATVVNVRYASDSGAQADIAGLPRWADAVEKVSV